MNSIFNDKAKIKVFAQIQDSLTNLKSNSENEAIDLIINQIPKSYLDQKDDLKTRSGTPSNYLKKLWIR